jgi:hypothetical protein
MPGFHIPPLRGWSFDVLAPTPAPNGSSQAVSKALVFVGFSGAARNRTLPSHLRASLPARLLHMLTGEEVMRKV